MRFRLLLAPLLLVACAETGGPAEDAPAGYEEDTSSADELITSHAVDALTAVVAREETHVVDQPIAALAGYTGALVAGQTVLVLREGRIDRTDARVVVDVDTLVTSVIAARDLADKAHPTDDHTGHWFTAHAAQADAPAAYEGLVTAESEEGAERIALTIDMCQSSRAWDKRLYDVLSSLGRERGRPLPIGVAMTGGWARRHRAELDDLLQRDGSSLAIEWVNHSNTHPLHCAGSTCAFMTHSSVDTKAEVLGLEQVLLGIGEVPGALFRFPGLMHDERRLRAVNDLGVFALDANAWLAKGQNPKAGSVILVHGNGNEPPGIVKVLDWLAEHRAEIVSGSIELVGPRAVIAP